ncbi:hypothetical protein WT27_25510 [Burkholderia territorii]|uniref:Uncharacterized protein n=2 Tax=Burkholderia territorii TaxID=1503055 RepID=A0A105VXC8_9BURK|nr:hypothetical protein [Burkholderia territorii]KVV55669.1 hypothetical protein WT27_25510 [Burkholderia territorii]KVX27641.1 hypothetical protein WT31_14200 [Burkholderia territorii]
MLLLSVAASAQHVTLTGKTTSKITAHVARPANLIVTDEKGGWFDHGLEMQQLGGWDTPYEVQARLKVVSTSGIFRVRLDSPLTIRHQSNPALAFRRPMVKLGAEFGELKLLAIERSAEFRNPAPPVAGADSVGYYVLDVSAYPPTGDFKSTAGAYSGMLSMTFEPVVRAP